MPLISWQDPGEPPVSGVDDHPFAPMLAQSCLVRFIAEPTHSHRFQ